MYKVQFNQLFGLDINNFFVRYFLFEKKKSQKSYYLIKLIEPFKIHPNFHEYQFFFLLIVRLFDVVNINAFNYLIN